MELMILLIILRLCRCMARQQDFLRDIIDRSLSSFVINLLHNDVPAVILSTLLAEHKARVTNAKAKDRQHDRANRSVSISSSVHDGGRQRLHLHSLQPNEKRLIGDEIRIGVPLLELVATEQTSCQDQNHRCCQEAEEGTLPHREGPSVC